MSIVNILLGIVYGYCFGLVTALVWDKIDDLKRVKYEAKETEESSGVLDVREDSNVLRIPSTQSFLQ